MTLRGFSRAYFVLWATTLAIALAVVILPGLSEYVRRALDLTFQSASDTIPDALTIWINNSATCLIPIFLLLLTDPSRGGLRLIIPVGILIASVVPSVVIVGTAIGAYTDRIVPYLIHLPLEWAALALPLSLWPAALDAPLPRRTLGSAALLTLAFTLSAALVEVFVTR